MKRIVIILAMLMMAVCSGYSLSSAADVASSYSAEKSCQETISRLRAKGLWVFDRQSFPADFENWGPVEFVTGTIGTPRKLNIYLISSTGEVLYTFPHAQNTLWLRCEDVEAVAFMDIDKDGLTDIIVIGIYSTGMKNAIYLPVATIFFQKGREFVNDPGLDKQINDAEKNKSIDMVLDFLANKSH